MDDLLRQHRQQQKELQSRITQKRESATKKTRKGVNDECTELERQLKEQQACELARLGNESHDVSAIVDEQDVSPDHSPPLHVLLDATEDTADELQSVSISTSAVQSKQVKKPSRQKARLARRAAEQEAAVKQAEVEAADLPDLREKETRSMREAYSAKGLIEHEIRSDGHCLYAAVADQINNAGINSRPMFNVGLPVSDKPGYQAIRQVAAAYIDQNSDEFVPFLEEPLGQYLQKIRETGEWGGHLEILAISKAYDTNINILHGDGHIDTIGSSSNEEKDPLWLAYYRHSHGLGEHYNSLRRKR